MERSLKYKYASIHIKTHVHMYVHTAMKSSNQRLRWLKIFLFLLNEQNTANGGEILIYLYLLKGNQPKIFNQF